jgi:hypothetical protein
MDDKDRETGTGRESPLTEALDLLGRRLLIGLCAAGGLIGLGIYAKPEAQRFEAFAANGEVFRLSTKSGTLIACNAERCTTVVRRGQRLTPRQEAKLFEAAPAAAPQSPLAAPAPEAPSLPATKP